MYYLFLDENFASDDKYQWHTEQKHKLNEFKREKDDIVTQNINQTDKLRAQVGQRDENMGLQFVKKLEEEISAELTRVQKGTEKAVEISTYIKLELNRQIEVLD